MAFLTGGGTQITFGALGTFFAAQLGAFTQLSPSMKILGREGYNGIINSGYGFPDPEISQLSPFPVLLFFESDEDPPQINQGVLFTLTITYPQAITDQDSATLNGAAFVTGLTAPEVAHNNAMFWNLLLQFDSPPIFIPATPIP